MFGTTRKTKQLSKQIQNQSDSLAFTAAAVADQLRERVVPAVGQATVNAKEWARPRVEHGIEVAAPRLESAVNNLAPKVDTARDKIVDELIPRIAEAISAWAVASAAAKDEAVSRGKGAASVLAGDSVAAPKGSTKKRTVLMGLSLLTAAGAAAMTFMKKSAPKDDPWTTPLADTYSAPNGRHPAGPSFDEAASTGKTAVATTPGSEKIDEKDAPSPVDPTRVADLTTTDAAANSETSSKGAGSDTTKSTTTKSTTAKSTTAKNGADADETDKDNSTDPQV